MKSPQVINLNEDSVLAFDGLTVISDSDQLPMGGPAGHMITSLSVAIDLLNLMSGSHVGPITPITMTYQSEVDTWTINIADISASLVDRQKYVALITDAGFTGMRAFKINEFAIDNDSFEDTWMRLPYQVEVSGGEAWIRWYDYVGNFGDLSHCKFEAAAYEGGTGINYATDPSRVTHRGPIVVVIPVTTTMAPT